MYQMSVIFVNFTSGVFLEKFSQTPKFWNSEVCYSSHKNLSLVRCWARKQSLKHYAHYFKIHFLLPRLLWNEVDKNSWVVLININQHSLEFLHNINRSAIHVFEKKSLRFLWSHYLCLKLGWVFICARQTSGFFP
jgi:hypothetical protein